MAMRQGTLCGFVMASAVALAVVLTVPSLHHAVHAATLNTKDPGGWRERPPFPALPRTFNPPLTSHNCNPC